VQVNAAVAADAGYVNFTRPDLPALSSDVVVRAPGDAPRAREATVQFGFDLGIDLGGAFYLHGSGLDTRVEGAVRLRNEGRGTIRASGAVEAKDGTYEGFGQKLAIERGRVNFQGAPENPGLDILALRKGLPVEVGVSITRTAANPLVRLYSDQPMADFEILSWLVLGRAADQTRADNAALVRAATGLLSGSGEGIPTRLARTLGIDEISVRSGQVGGAGSILPRQSVAGSLRGTEVGTASAEIITIGKRVSDAVTISYEQALSGAANVVQLSYQLSRRLSLVARAGTENALDLVYSIVFD
jgi:translocation and assembly module TamB